MDTAARRLRTPAERVGMLPNASLPPPGPGGAASADELLCRALKHGDESAFARVMDLHFPGMLRLALAHVHDRAMAEDVIQETWMAALRGFHRFEGRSTVRTWLYRILRNLARTRGSRESRTRPFSELHDGAAPDLDLLDVLVDASTGRAGYGLPALWGTSADPAQQLLDRELVEHIEQAMSVLPQRQREVIMLRDVEGWSAEEVCNTLEISQTNQRVLLHRAREKVREELQEYLTDYNVCDDDERHDVH